MRPKSKKDKYTVECKTQEETVSVLNYINNEEDNDWSYWKYVTRFGNYDSDINDSINENIKEYTIISFEEWQILPDEEFILPEKWCIQYNGEPEIEKYLLSKKDFNHDYDVRLHEWVISEPGNDGSYQKWREGIPNEYTEITFQQFKEHVFNNLEDIKHDINFETQCGNKYILHDHKPMEIIGYKLIKPEYNKAVKRVTGCQGFDFDRFETNVIEMKYVAGILSDLNVLNVWFEPVYESSTEEKIKVFLAKRGIELYTDDIKELIELVNEK